ncbi:MAG: hypothetical protein EOO65_05880 [Methanosarcinales archaeon]|nr:MAG: hypothetical protein EOO65_05880 [Methanosarcinales archaeon]
MENDWSIVVQHADRELHPSILPNTTFWNNPPVAMIKQLYALNRCAQLVQDLGRRLHISFDVIFRLRPDHDFGAVQTPNFPEVFSSAWGGAAPTNNQLLPNNTLQVPNTMDWNGLQDRIAWGSSSAFFCTNSRYQYTNSTKVLHGESFHKFSAYTVCSCTVNRVSTEMVGVREVPHAEQRCAPHVKSWNA